MEHYFSKAPGVFSVTSGFAGGGTGGTSYKAVSSGKTDHAEVIEVLYDDKKTDYESLTRLFFEIHDPTQKDGQGPDLGRQYRSAIFFDTPEQKKIAEKLAAFLQTQGVAVVTEITMTDKFIPASDYHQGYYSRTGGEPYCHVRKPRDWSAVTK